MNLVKLVKVETCWGDIGERLTVEFEVTKELRHDLRGMMAVDLKQEVSKILGDEIVQIIIMNTQNGIAP